MKGLVTVACTVLACTMILPLILAGVYYRNDGSDLIEAEVTAEQLLELPEYDTEAEQTEETSEQTDAQTDAQTDDDMFSEERDDEDYLAPPATEEQTEEMTEEATEEMTEEATEKETEKVTDKVTQAPTEAVTQAPTPSEDIESVGGNGADSIKLRVYMHKKKTYVTMTLAEYVRGVIAAEMPTYFELEAFKAQAVAVRTYTIYKLVNDSNYHASSHGSTGADLCTSSGHCQGFTTYEDRVESWGQKTADAVWDKVTKAVEQTEGQVLLYNNEPILAVYHSCSYKRTESGKNTWGDNTPYLVSVTTPESNLDVVYTERSFTADKFKKTLTSANKNADFSGDPSTWVGKFTYNESGRVATVTIGGVTYTGRKVQSLFSLRGSNFDITYDADSGEFVFDVRGWGHGCGMSQYGANEMAKSGKDYDEILLHYYSGVSIKRHNYK